MKTILLLLPLLLASCADPIHQERHILISLVLAAGIIFCSWFICHILRFCSKPGPFPAPPPPLPPRRPSPIVDTEALAELMHDAYQTSGIVETRKIVLWQGIRNEPEKHAERNAWRAAARAVAKRLA